MGDRVETWQDLGSRVAQARKVARLSQADLATVLDLDRTAVTKIEAGDRKIDSLELARIAVLLHRSVDWFLSPPLPSAASRRQSRESLEQVEESSADALLESIARDVELLQELELLGEPREPSPRHIDSVVTAEHAAAKLRDELDVPPGPIWDLGEVVERAGLFGFSLELEAEALEGSYLRLKAGGVALVNGKSHSSRRRFTLVHELGHHVFADDFSAEWIVGSDKDVRERLINAFAIHFLLPRDAVGTRWEKLQGRDEPYRAAIMLGAEFGISWTALLGHLRNLRVIDTPLFEQLGQPFQGDCVAGTWG